MMCQERLEKKIFDLGSDISIDFLMHFMFMQALQYL
jgi:hypothetical protein